MERALALSSPKSVGLSHAGLAKVDDALRVLIDQGELAGAVTLVARRGRLVHLAAMGAKDLATGEPLRTDTLFRIYSMTKPVLGVAMMILYEAGFWKPEDPIGRFLPGFGGLKVFAGRDSRGRALVRDANHAPTMGELMTHTAGFTYGFDPNDALDALYLKADLWQSASLAEFAAKVSGLPLAYQPGERWLYSLSMDLQGAIVEAISGQSLPAFMQERIFAPLGMHDTAFHTPPEKRHRLAVLYRKSSRRGLVPMERPLFPDREAPPAVASGGGGLVSTAGDYARFAQMLLNGGSFADARLLSPQSLGLMMSNHLSDTMMMAGFGVGHQQLRPGYGYGYNGAIFTDPVLAGIPVGNGTYQWDGAAGTWFWVDPENDLLFVGLIQRMDPASPALQMMTQRLIAEALE
jgi:CubicO group peptidase (beta-lactamase class C family)